MVEVRVGDQDEIGARDVGVDGGGVRDEVVVWAVDAPRVAGERRRGRRSERTAADPQARQSLEYFLTPGGMAFLMIFGSAFMCVLFVILSGIGGAISAALLRRKLPPH